jgi:biotin transport system substrate-specific component
MTFQTKNKLSSTSATILAVRIRQRFPMGSWELLFQLIGLLLLGLSARFALPIPGSEVPISLQTLAVVVLGAWLGPVRASLLLVLYLLLGGLGLPLFAGGRSGWEVVLGPSSGFLLGFVLAAAFVGAWVKKKGNAFLPILLGVILAHLLILAVGYLVLGWKQGFANLSAESLLALLPGLVLKSLLGALLIRLSNRWLV